MVMENAPQATSTTRLRVPLPILATFAVGALFGYAAGSWSASVKEGSRADEAVKKVMQRAGIQVPTELETSQTLTGTVVNVGDDSFTFDIRYELQNPLGTEPPVRRKVLLSDATKIIVVRELNADEVRKNEDAYQLKIAAWVPEDGPPPTPPEFTKRADGTRGDVVKGMVVSVISENDILYKTDITAVEVVVRK